MDLAPVAAFMDARGLGSGPLENVRPIVGGTQNVMLRFARAGREYVLRRGPEHLRPGSNDVIRREWPAQIHHKELQQAALIADIERARAALLDALELSKLA